MNVLKVNPRDRRREYYVCTHTPPPARVAAARGRGMCRTGGIIGVGRDGIDFI